MRKVKLFEEFLGAEPKEAPVKPQTKPDVKPATKPARPSPLRNPRPNVDPAPKATATDVVDRFAEELDELSDKDKEIYLNYLRKKYSK